MWKQVCECVFEKSSLCVSASSSCFSCCLKGLLKCDTNNWEQLYAFCIWLRKQSPAVCICYTPVMMNTCLFLRSLWQLRIYSWLLDWRDRRARECVGLRICVTHFRCFIPSAGIRFDKVGLNINVITGGFCCCQDFCSPQLPLRVESSVCLAELMM